MEIVSVNYRNRIIKIIYSNFVGWRNEKKEPSVIQKLKENWKIWGILAGKQSCLTSNNFKLLLKVEKHPNFSVEIIENNNNTIKI